MTAEPIDDPAEATRPDALTRALILTTLTMVTALYAMTVTIANVSLPQMQGALSATTDQIALVVTFNIIATAVATPMTGWLAARFSRRTILLWGVSGFTVASLACGLAPTLELLVVARVFQGAFGAPLVPLSQAIVMDSYPKHQQGSAMAIFGMGVVLGPVLAPTIGGYLSEVYNWRWVFFMIVPCGLAALAGVAIYIQDRSKAGSNYLDWTGFLTLAMFIAAFQFMLDQGERLDWFDSATILLCGAVAALMLYLFIAHSLTAERPFLDPKLLLDRNYAIGLLLVFVFGMLNFTPMTLLPALLQGVRGYPDSIIGVVLGARGVGTLVGFFFMFWGSKLDPRPTLAAGFALQGIAGWYMSQFSINLTTFDVLWTSALQGLGVGLVWVPLTVVSFNTLPREKTSEATAIFHLVRNFGSSIYISIAISIALNSARVNYAEMTAHARPTNEALQFQDSLFRVWSLDGAGALAGLSGEMARQAAMIGYLNSFYAFTLTSFAVLPLMLLIRLRR
ncbi:MULTISPECIES: DHA2 family efflux MFS transporter permease subunit [Thalassobaculum]|uniref:MFS transporter, DHA2 family, multidrug resistance protein n=1 Tax=Thalassobaculum litoreum DSM 18839 TaxID=1123362 RepID=A0A8G2BHP7_9PROT|nr:MULTISPECIES: DHA2 family efflux MFS transporter permease subunit [Thalassobaculum]SDF39435.1 MFS transporter, DHA2 family, multidrug resistance protein [Thalassobaculum litoreum DSM 18839]